MKPRTKEELEQLSTGELNKILKTEQDCDVVMSMFGNMQARPRHLEALKQVQFIEEILSERSVKISEAI
jgi:hypothetical protein